MRAGAGRPGDMPDPQDREWRFDRVRLKAGGLSLALSRFGALGSFAC
ncbi:hypothetical protein BOS5A_200179 [Bosea sp. EC-HK365B]|nr:hypothetical protein BOS5A_200179 [Bosea sp. EC-HK365B]VXC97139.1 hypothetical protein BOSE29B_90168 [Bosea sp. 29B]